MSSEDIVFLVFCLAFIIPTVYVLLPNKSNKQNEKTEKNKTE